MSFTTADLQAIQTAIASGERRVRLQDKEVEFRTLQEMLQIQALIQNSLAPENKTGMKRVQMQPDKGYL